MDLPNTIAFLNYILLFCKKNLPYDPAKICFIQAKTRAERGACMHDGRVHKAPRGVIGSNPTTLW
jgi:hypothetical protein